MDFEYNRTGSTRNAPVTNRNTRERRLSQKKKKRKLMNRSDPFDMPFLVTLAVLLLIGLIMMFSASYPNAYYYKGNSYSYFLPQLAFVLMGFVGMLIVSTVDYHYFRSFSFIVYIGANILLLLVLLMPGEGGVKRWLNLGISFQPSEVAKFAIILLLAYWGSAHLNEMNRLSTGFFMPACFAIPILFFLFFEPHYSCMVIIIMLTALMLFLAGANKKYFIIALILLALGIAVLYFTGLLSYATERLDGWGTALDYRDDPDWRNQTWQTRNSLFAIGSGGLTGLGPGQSRQKYLFLPEPQNDFIFAIICEELGFIGAVAILLIFAYLVLRGILVCSKAPDTFGKLLGVGLCSQIGLQVVLNIMVITDWMPNTGISLPFFSYGGSSMLMLLFQMGIVLSITRQCKVEKT